MMRDGDKIYEREGEYFLIEKGFFNIVYNLSLEKFSLYILISTLRETTDVPPKIRKNYLKRILVR